ncbi:MAG TPA: hypothetical protein VKZ72_00370 [Acidimicrobiales bacterium]|nr:hypothetical protein [Acidimicrobiales bacterium]
MRASPPPPPQRPPATTAAPRRLPPPPPPRPRPRAPLAHRLVGALVALVAALAAVLVVLAAQVWQEDERQDRYRRTADAFIEAVCADDPDAC